MAEKNEQKDGQEKDERYSVLSDTGIALSKINDPSDTDVLCGRGGAALRHPGNQTYRRLVSLNKGLYITCLKAEKLKISKSIVAAIREQKGRFLERDSSDNTWYDIGDKKAMEKTSQALREGQPKLRQKIVEMGGGATGAAALYDAQVHGAQHQPQMQQAQFQDSISSIATQMQNNLSAMQHIQGNMGGIAGLNSYDASQILENMMMPSIHNGMPPPMDPHSLQPQALMSGGMNDGTIGAPDVQLSRLSLVSSRIGEESGQNPMSSSSFRSRLRPSLQLKGSQIDLGINQSTMSLLSDFSAIGGEASARSLMNDGDPNVDLGLKRMDPRKAFARMKHRQPGSMRSSSSRNILSSKSTLTPSEDMLLVESSPSLYSNISQDNLLQGYVPNADVSVFESRRSLMSGLSKISDSNTEAQSIFSDLSRKIGNVSTRSIAMSEISSVDPGEGDDDDDDDIGVESLEPRAFASAGTGMVE
mmetsp:Transcript_28872/g.44380  ORF Transcript_28872/g.44380 Transcript_28872/m.44380 type:complete len:474 (+) Transcript_28872:176-1597(+)|eukprot:CAMPEP_0118708640 /NCGR_PEP_ID=MMETSP0800-20121206/22040_1 /TAXON_ID=210618 ORGANISM="Striatella unipunctata, Strain CCMP2910" /NCGR_SAMPLE_ID=MMETSP0800 /ASSEMBLY_ACC=CAM_ASM_000638 /LENGTH=473 /DNA_ID=CAMNT_0006611937 /DNA_START=125 /DNA_END=1546 /DNA_ORIENTATION=+